MESMDLHVNEAIVRILRLHVLAWDFVLAYYRWEFCFGILLELDAIGYTSPRAVLLMKYEGNIWLLLVLQYQSLTKDWKLQLRN